MKTLLVNSVSQTGHIQQSSVRCCDVGPVVAARAPHLYLINPPRTED